MARLIEQHELTTEQIAKIAGVSRKGVFNRRGAMARVGLAELLTRERAVARTVAMRGAVAEEFDRAVGSRTVPAGAGRAGVGQKSAPAAR